MDYQKLGASPVGVCVAWRVAGSQAVFGNGRSSDAGVLRHSLCQPVKDLEQCKKFKIVKWRETVDRQCEAPQKKATNESG
ncbi:hypothetical protein PSPTOT1_0553 [Pseudomonas syringae pv. tomato T1]|nr:hypothetical protein PSPTOT1_0553 [Pseudomonas syringae pv. tomato T1]